MWGVSPEAGQFASGSGSYDPNIVIPYLESVTNYITSLDFTPDAVDLGCGDFSIGNQLRPLFGTYTACDVVAKVIDRNCTRYATRGVDFRVLDIANDPLPPGDIVFIRQVLQHLSNETIDRVLTQVMETYSVLILTEHLPIDPAFVPNIDIPTGPGVRLDFGSGVDITRPPFRVPVSSQEVICDVMLDDSRILTTVYHFQRLN